MKHMYFVDFICEYIFACTCTLHMAYLFYISEHTWARFEIISAHIPFASSSDRTASTVRKKKCYFIKINVLLWHIILL